MGEPSKFIFIAYGRSYGGRAVSQQAGTEEGARSFFRTQFPGGELEQVVKYKRANPECFICQKDTDEDSYCHGCGNYVCPDCVVSYPLGPHTLEDHLKEEDEEGDG